MEFGSVEIWTIAGVILLIAEILAVSFFFMFFGLGALATALLTYMDITPDLFSQLIAFILVSVGSLLLFRNQLRLMFDRKGAHYKEIIDERAKVSIEIPEHGEGKVFYRGTEWLAEEINKNSIAKDVMVRIKKVDGIRLIVEKE